MTRHDSAARAAGSPDQMEQRPVATERVPPFASIYEQYFDFVWASARRLGVSPASMDDIVQDVFIVIHAKIHTLKEPSALRSWIYGIVRRTVSDHHRSQRTRAASGAVLATEPPPAPPTPFALAERNDRVELLWSLLQTLDPAKREVFLLAEVEQMTVPEIAEILQIPLNTAYSRLRAARIAFEEALARRTGEGER
ncbi:MAG TPA: sigma-70 family RNA polymerase sigma factor [Polyangiaceae bacterium]|nr:sigma-70 family RNA polymerase sigma factor [Polyangiaceae bacterium]